MYFNAVYSALMHAREEIYIMGWWICPQLYLRRPGKMVRPTTASVSLSAFTAQRRRAVGSGYFPLRPICPSPSRVFACGVCLEPRERCEVRALRSACLAIRAERVAAAHARVREPCRAGPHGRGQAVGCSRRGQARLGLARLSGLKRAEKEAGMAARGLAARPRSAAQGKGGR